MSNKKTVNYFVINQYIEKNNCKLITSESEWEEYKYNTKSKLKILASCGHMIENSYQSFIYRARKMCRKCIMKSYRIENKTKVHNERCVSTYSIQESECFEILKNMLTEKFDIKKDSINNNVYIKLKNNEKWVCIKIKSTSSKDIPQINFSVTKKGHFDFSIFIGIHLYYKRYWIIPKEYVSKNISIGLQNSKKFGVFEVYENNFIEYLIFYYKKFINIDNCSLENINLEKMYKENRDKYIDFIDIQYSSISDLGFICKINNYIIQDKMGKYKSPEIIEFYINKKSSPYFKGDNDFYWFHFPDFEIFYLIPENELINQGYISTEYQDGKTCIYFGTKFPENYKTSWAIPYRFNYKNLNKEFFLKLLNYI